MIGVLRLSRLASSSHPPEREGTPAAQTARCFCAPPTATRLCSPLLCSAAPPLPTNNHPPPPPPLPPPYVPSPRRTSLAPRRHAPPGVRKEVEVDGRSVLIFWYRNQIYCIQAKSPAEGAYSEGFIKAKFSQVRAGLSSGRLSWGGEAGQGAKQGEAGEPGKAKRCRTRFGADRLVTLRWTRCCCLLRDGPQRRSSRSSSSSSVVSRIWVFRPYPLQPVR